MLARPHQANGAAPYAALLVRWGAPGVGAELRRVVRARPLAVTRCADARTRCRRRLAVRADPGVASLSSLKLTRWRSEACTGCELATHKCTLLICCRRTNLVERWPPLTAWQHYHFGCACGHADERILYRETGASLVSRWRPFSVATSATGCGRGAQPLLVTGGTLRPVRAATRAGRPDPLNRFATERSPPLHVNQVPQTLGPCSLSPAVPRSSSAAPAQRGTMPPLVAATCVPRLRHPRRATRRQAPRADVATINARAQTALWLALFTVVFPPLAAAAPPHAVQLNLVDDFLEKGWTARCVRAGDVSRPGSATWRLHLSAPLCSVRTRLCRPYHLHWRAQV